MFPLLNIRSLVISGLLKPHQQPSDIPEYVNCILTKPQPRTTSIAIFRAVNTLARL